MEYRFDRGAKWSWVGNNIAKYFPAAALPAAAGLATYVSQEDEVFGC